MFAGSIVALVTPMDADGRINYGDLAKLIEFHIGAGTEALVIAGTTGESATLTRDEHIGLIQRACDLVDGRVPVIAGTGSNSTAQTTELSKAVDRLPVDGFLDPLVGVVVITVLDRVPQRLPLPPVRGAALPALGILKFWLGHGRSPECVGGRDFVRALLSDPPPLSPPR